MTPKNSPNRLGQTEVTGDAGERPLVPGEFYKKTWKIFRVRHNIEILFDDRPSYFAHKELICAGLFGFMLFGAGSANRSMMAIAAATAIEEIEFKNRVKLKRNLREVDKAIRYQQVGLTFLEEIYYPCGGATTFMKGDGISTINARMKSLASSVSSAVSIVRVMHFVALHQKQKQALRPSVENSIMSLLNIKSEEKFGADRGRRNLQNHWSAHKQSSLLLYAASTVMVPGINISLLDWLLVGEFEHEYTDLINPVREMIRKASYIHKAVLSHSADSEFYRDMQQWFADIEPEIVPVPMFEQDILSTINGNFKLTRV